MDLLLKKYDEIKKMEQILPAGSKKKIKNRAEYNADFVNLLLYNRNNTNEIADYIVENGSYKKYSQIFKNRDIYNLFLGRDGFEYNKQKAIYEFPTLELIYFILSISKILRVSKIEEIMAGQGLLSCVLNKIISQHKLKHRVISTDNFSWLDTIGKPYFYKIKRKSIDDYIDESRHRNLNSNVIYIISWPSSEIIDSSTFFTFLDIVNIKCIILIGKIEDYIKKYKNPKYLYIHLLIKQVCYLDYFPINRHLTSTYFSHSNVTIILNKKYITKNDMDNIYSNISLFRKHNACKKIDKIYTTTFDQCIFDLIKYKKIPPWIINSKNNSSVLNKIKYYISNKINIPLFIQNENEFLFWNKISMKKKFPQNIISRDKFLEYLKFIELSSNIMEFKKMYNIPKWIKNKNELHIFLFLEFSTNNDDKLWKISRNIFLRKYFELYI